MGRPKGSGNKKLANETPEQKAERLAKNASTINKNRNRKRKTETALTAEKRNREGGIEGEREGKMIEALKGEMEKIEREYMRFSEVFENSVKAHFFVDGVPSRVTGKDGIVLQQETAIHVYNGAESSDWSAIGKVVRPGKDDGLEFSLESRADTEFDWRRDVKKGEFGTPRALKIYGIGAIGICVELCAQNMRREEVPLLYVLFKAGSPPERLVRGEGVEEETENLIREIKRIGTSDPPEHYVTRLIFECFFIQMCGKERTIQPQPIEEVDIWEIINGEDGSAIDTLDSPYQRDYGWIRASTFRLPVVVTSSLYEQFVRIWDASLGTIPAYLEREEFRDLTEGRPWGDEETSDVHHGALLTKLRAQLIIPQVANMLLRGECARAHRALHWFGQIWGQCQRKEPSSELIGMMKRIGNNVADEWNVFPPQRKKVKHVLLTPLTNRIHGKFFPLYSIDGKEKRASGVRLHPLTECPVELKKVTYGGEEIEYVSPLRKTRRGDVLSTAAIAAVRINERVRERDARIRYAQQVYEDAQRSIGLQPVGERRELYVKLRRIVEEMRLGTEEAANEHENDAHEISDWHESWQEKWRTWIARMREVMNDEQGSSTDEEDVVYHEIPR